MSKKKIVFLMILLLLIGVTVSLSVERRTQLSVRTPLATYEESELSSICFIKGNESWILINDGGWKTIGERGLSEAAISNIVATLLKFDGKPIARGDIDKSVYGIDSDSVKVEYIRISGEKKTLTLGDKTPAGTEYYLSDETDTVYSVISSVGSVMATEKSQVVESFVYGKEYSDIMRIEVDGTPQIKLLKKQDKWIFEGGDYTEEISVEKIRSDVTRHFGAMYALEVFDETEALNEESGFSGNPATCTVTITDTQNNKDKIYIGKETEKGVYIKVNDNHEIYLVIKDYFKFINLFREAVM